MSVAAGLPLVLAYPPFHVIPLAFLLPIFLMILAVRCQSFWQGFRYGFLVSTVLMLGGFYWVVYVIHVFGNLPWIVAGLLFVGFCGMGALNFPLFMAFAAWIHRRLPIESSTARWARWWFLLGLPALFTFIEFLIPKLFPWYISHALYLWLWFVQIADLTGCTFLTFAICSFGGLVTCWILQKEFPNLRPTKSAVLFVAGIWAVIVSYGGYRSTTITNEGKKTLDIATVQANIGSLDKLLAKRGIGAKVRHVVEKYTSLTEDLLANNPPPDLILWPETAMPFYLVGKGSYTVRIHNLVKRWNVPLLSGGYAPHPSRFHTDRNAAFLMDPKANEDGTLRLQSYYKNILLAFGEYLPFGEWFPVLYRWFPQIANFKPGERQDPVVLNDGTRIGVTICYEAIVPDFYRKVARNDVNLIINLTNDSWFGPTSEPSQHGALSVFRAIETRIPMVRSTNTGISFVVDSFGRVSNRMGIGHVGSSISKIDLTPHGKTLYLIAGDWFVFVCFFLFLILVFVRYKEFKA